MVVAAEKELGLPVSTTVYGPGNTDATGTQMGALANRVLDELRRMNRWVAQQFEFNLVVDVPVNTTGNMAPQSHVISNIPDTSAIQANFWQVSGPGIPVAARVASVDSATQVTMTMENTNTEALTGQAIQFQHDTYQIPANFDYFNNQTMWDRTNRWSLIGPDSPQLDQWQRSGIVSLGPRRHFRQLSPYSSTFRIWPAPAEIVAPLQLVFEYLSLSAVQVNSGPTPTYAQYFTNDMDTPLLDENAIVTGIKWMFWEAKGFGSYVTLQQRWVDYVERLAARDGGAPTLAIVQRQNPLLISPSNTQDGYFPGPGGPSAP